jgi:polyisoprenoid-binding protein YceI
MSPTNWNIDTSHSSVGFSVRHMMFAKVRGRFAKWSGAIALDPDDLVHASVKVSIDAASIDTGVTDRDNHLRSPDFFAAEQFPALEFASTRIESVGGDRYRVHGNLTIRGITREVVLDAEHGGRAKDPWGNQRVAFAATTSVNRTDFGLKWNQLVEAGGVLVGERVDIELEIQAVEAAATAAA